MDGWMVVVGVYRHFQRAGLLLVTILQECTAAIQSSSAAPGVLLGVFHSARTVKKYCVKRYQNLQVYLA